LSINITTTSYNREPCDSFLLSLKSGVRFIVMTLSDSVQYSCNTNFIILIINNIYSKCNYMIFLLLACTLTKISLFLPFLPLLHALPLCPQMFGQNSWYNLFFTSYLYFTFCISFKVCFNINILQPKEDKYSESWWCMHVYQKTAITSTDTHTQQDVARFATLNGNLR